VPETLAVALRRDRERLRERLRALVARPEVREVEKKAPARSPGLRASRKCVR
jgi:hypothetical protein